MSIKSVIPRILKVNVPEVATKLLKFRKANDKKIMTLSSNWLPLFGFHGDARVVEEMIAPGKGYQIRLATDADEKTKKVYVREYKSRSANPLKKDAKRVEQLVETAGQKIINEAMGDAEYVHITFRFGVLTFTPVTSVERKLVQDLSVDDKINTLVAMTGGVDAAVLEQGGFRVDTIVEYRPQEKRDKTEYTELTALSSLINSKPRVLCNEDIYTLNVRRLADTIGNTPITVLHASLQCDDYSPLKTNKQKADSVVDLSSTLDMFIPTLNLLDELSIPVLMIENVPGFMSSPINDVLVLQLRRRGYHVHQQVFDAREFGGNTSRKRLYLVASTLDAPFAFPTPEQSNVDVWRDIIEPNLDEIMTHDLTDNKVMKDAIRMERARIIHKDKPFSPTLTKAQGQSTKDSVVVLHEGRYYKLPMSLQMKLNELPESFDLDWAPLDKAEQIIGQSISCALHHRIAQSVREHILGFAKSLSNTFTGQASFAF
jgi:DNA (cytosine-5)-methyltransferase 1